MSTQKPTAEEVLDAIRRCARELGRVPSRHEFKSQSGITEYWVVQHYGSWRDAQRAAGLEPHTSNIKLTDEELLVDWAGVVREHRRIPTRDHYRRDGKFSPGVFEKRFGPWSGLPRKFREFAKDKPEWIDVVTLLPETTAHRQLLMRSAMSGNGPAGDSNSSVHHQYARLGGRPTYGNPIDFRGLRHEPVNEQGVVFLFGMVAKELGYMLEAMQTGYPDCEAKRQVRPGHWQRVRIEFEFESRNFRDHGHPPEDCDVIVCWRHNWPECPEHLEVVELASIISTLGKSDD